MPTREDQTLMQFRGWAGGLNRDTNEILLEQDEASECLNVDFNEDGQVVKRLGFTKWSTSDLAAMEWGTDIYHFRESDGTDWLIYVDTDRELYEVEVDAGTTLARSVISGPTDIVVGADNTGAVINNKFYISATVVIGFGWSFDGTTWTKITDLVMDGSGTEFPSTAKLVNTHERLFACNTNTGGGVNKKFNRIWFSGFDATTNEADPELWKADDWIDINPDDGQKIRDAVAFGEKIVIVKDHSLYVLSGVDASSFTLFPVDSEVGTIARRTLQASEGIAVWFDPQSGVWAFDGASFKPVDKKMNLRILNGLATLEYNNTLATNRVINAFIRDGRYYLSVPWTEAGGGSDTFAKYTFVWDFRNDTWTEYDYAFQDVVAIDDVYYGVGPFRDGDSAPAKGIFKLFDGNADNTNAIKAFIETPWFAPQDGFIHKHRLRKLLLYLTGSNSSPATIDIDMYLDWIGGTVSLTATQSASTSTKDMVVSDLSTFDKLGNAFKIRLGDDSTNPWQINGIDILFTSRILIRGDQDS